MRKSHREDVQNWCACKYLSIYLQIALPERSRGGGGRDKGRRGGQAGESGSPGVLGRGAGMIFFMRWGSSARESSCLSCHCA